MTYTYKASQVGRILERKLKDDFLEHLEESMEYATTYESQNLLTGIDTEIAEWFAIYIEGKSWLPEDTMDRWSRLFKSLAHDLRSEAKDFDGDSQWMKDLADKSEDVSNWNLIKLTSKASGVKDFLYEYKKRIDTLSVDDLQPDVWMSLRDALAEFKVGSFEDAEMWMKVAYEEAKSNSWNDKDAVQELKYLWNLLK